MTQSIPTDVALHGPAASPAGGAQPCGNIVSWLAALALIFFAAVSTPCAADAVDENAHLDPLQTVARFLKLTQSGRTADIRAAARMIEQDRRDLAWANDQLDSTSRDMLQTMHVYNFAAILSRDPVAGQPEYSLRRRPAARAETPPPPSPAAAAGELDALLGADPPAAPPPAPPPPEEITEARAERAIVRLASGRTVVMLKSPEGNWMLLQFSSSLQARADWVATRDRDLELPPSSQFRDFYLDLQAHDTDYAWRVVMALGEAGRFVDLGRLIVLPPPEKLPPDADPQATAAADLARQTRMEEQGRLLYSWLRRSKPSRIRLEPSGFKLPEGVAPDGPKLPAVRGEVANFAIWTDDFKPVRLVASPRPVPPDTVDFGQPVFRWQFDCDCYSPETKRAWIHAQRQNLPEQ